MGKSKSVIGYKYYLGQHAVLCQKADALLELRFGEKTIWTGENTGGAISLNDPNFFGGEKKGGGIVGTVRFLLGEATQTAPVYLASVLTAPIPAFRGVVSFVWEKINMGNSPYPPRYSVKLINKSQLFDDWRSDVRDITTDSFTDLNPIHIIRDVLLDTDNGGAGDASIIGATFDDVADLLYSENFGLSLIDASPSNADEFVKEIERHCDVKVFADRVTGQWQVKAIRNDYTTSSLFVFDQSNIEGWVDTPERPRERELVNQITLKYTKRSDGNSASITMSNTAAIATFGRVIPETVSYPGITNPDLAAKVLKRDLLARSRPLRSGGFYAVYAPTDLNIGSPFVISDTRVGMSGVVARVIELEEPTISDNRYLIRWIEDAFDFDATLSGFITVDDEILPPTGALALTYQFAIETPYWVTVSALGQSSADDYLAADPDAGTFIGSGGKPDGRHVDIAVAVDAGTGYDVGAGTSDFTPYMVLSADVARTATSMVGAYNSTIDEIDLGDVMLVDEEFVRVDAISTVSGVTTLTVGRGCLDTVPRPHASGAAMFDVYPFAQGDSEIYTAAEAIDVKLLPLTAGSGVAIGDATAIPITFNSRGIRPYPVGDFKVDGTYSPTGLQSGNVTLTWAHRDRTIQITTTPEDHTESSIGPETGVTYHLVRQWVRADGVTVDYQEIGASLGQVTTTIVDVDDATFGANALGTSAFLGLGILVRRDGYDSWQFPVILLEVSIVVTGDAFDGGLSSRTTLNTVDGGTSSRTAAHTVDGGNST